MDALLDDAQVLLARGETKTALDTIGRVLAAEPENVRALLLRARSLEQGREDAEAAYADVVRAAPRSSEALNALALYLHRLSRDEEALDVARRAEAVLSEGDNFRHAGPVYLTLVYCLRAQNKLREALGEAERGLLRSHDAVLAQWASVVEEELAEAEKERC
jgi:tetratricopeptide (TPR) repeat protein